MSNNTSGNSRHLDVELEVLVHRKDVIENVLSDTRNDSHLVRIMQLALKQEVTGISEGISRYEVVIFFLGSKVN